MGIFVRSALTNQWKACGGVAHRVEPRLLIVAQRYDERMRECDIHTGGEQASRQFAPTACGDPNCVERKYNLSSLTPKRGFIATEAVEGIIGQIAEPQETTCELNTRSNLALG